MEMNGNCVLSPQVLRGLFFVDARKVDVFRRAKLLPAEAGKHRRRSGSLGQGGGPEAVPISGHRVLQDSYLYVGLKCEVLRADILHVSKVNRFCETSKIMLYSFKAKRRFYK